MDVFDSKLLDEVGEPFSRFGRQFHASYHKRWDRVQCRYGRPYVQRVRADFFNVSGGPLRLPFGLAVSDIVVAAGGVATLVL